MSRLRALLAVVPLLVVVACQSNSATPTNTNSGTPRPGAGIAPDALVFDSDRGGNYEIFTARVDGSGVRQLTDDRSQDSWWPRLSPDRTRILFYRTPKGTHDTDFTVTSLWMMAADGTDARVLRAKGADGWDQQGHAEWSPDGTQLVMFGGSRSNPQIFVTKADATGARQLTSRGGTNIDPSWSPDGKTIAFVGCPQAICFPKDYEVYVMPAAGGEAKRLTSNDLRDHDPYFSPDGTRIAWLEQTDASGPTGVWNIQIMRADGTDQRHVTDDREINSKPDWAKDGSLIFFHRFEHARGRWRLFSIRPDGTGLQEVVRGGSGNDEFPSR